MGSTSASCVDDLKVAAISPNPHVERVVVTKYKEVRYCWVVSVSATPSAANQDYE